MTSFAAIGFVLQKIPQHSMNNQGCDSTSAPAAPGHYPRRLRASQVFLCLDFYYLFCRPCQQKFAEIVPEPCSFTQVTLSAKTKRGAAKAPLLLIS
jgi:hypothetical protein